MIWAVARMLASGLRMLCATTGDQRPERRLALRLDQDALALGELAGHLAERRGEMPDLLGALGRDPMREVPAAHLDGSVDQLPERVDEAHLQAASREKQERHRQRDGERHHDRRPPRPARTRGVEPLA